MKRKAIYIVMLAVSLMAVGVCMKSFMLQPRATIAQPRFPEVGSAAPSFRLKALDGQVYAMEEQKPKVLFFWASWCQTCRAEAQIWNELYDRYKDNVQFLGINATSQDSKESAASFAQKAGWSFPVLLDEDGQTTVDYHILAVPTIYLIDRMGQVVERVYVLETQEWEQKLSQLAAL